MFRYIEIFRKNKIIIESNNNNNNNNNNILNDINNNNSQLNFRNISVDNKLINNNIINFKKEEPVNRIKQRKFTFKLSNQEKYSNNLLINQIQQKIKKKFTKFSLLNTIKYILFCNKKYNNNNHYNYVLDYLNNRLDVTFYLKLIEKFDRFKVLFLNYYQNISLDYVKKPNINNKNDLDLLDIDFKKDYEKEISGIILYFKQKLEKNEMNECDNHLLEMLDPIIQQKIYVK
jgi:hypothetical protein